jgi:hypothetical protein
VGTEPTERADLDPQGDADPARATQDGPADDAYWPTGEPKLSPTEMWMEHKGWAS